MHKANYVTESVVKSQGYAGRSLGCPAVSPAIINQLLKRLKTGLVFLFTGRCKVYYQFKILKRKPKLESAKEPAKEESFSTR